MISGGTCSYATKTIWRPTHLRRRPFSQVTTIFISGELQSIEANPPMHPDEVRRRPILLQ
ncbi:hypothetical protein OROHE_027287 [Orobanche hederae]